MASSQRSLRITDLYRQRVFALRDSVQRRATDLWPSIEELDSSDWSDRAAEMVAQAQVQALRSTSGYLTAFLSSELGRRVPTVQIDTAAYAGVSSDGRPLVEGMRSPIIGVLARLKAGDIPDVALAYGLDRAKRQTGMDLDAAHRTALLETIDRDDRFDGWDRALRGTCGACAGRAHGPDSGLRFQVHPGCQCVSEPRVSGVSHSFPRPTGTEIFAAKSRLEQDAMLGPEAAAKVRAGDIVLADLVDESDLDSQENFITQAPTG